MLNKSNYCSKSICNILDGNSIPYDIFIHKESISSKDAKENRFFKDKTFKLSQGMKSLIIKDKEDKKYLIVIPGDKKFDNKKLKSLLKTNEVRMVSESELETTTNGVKRGGVPPFGNIFDLPTIVDKNIFNEEEIVFNCGESTISIVMQSNDYKNVTKPLVCDIV